MTRLDPDLERLGDALRASTTIDLARVRRAGTDAGTATGARRPRRRILAGGTLGLAGAGAALVLALSGSSPAPAFAVTRQDDGTVLVQLNYTTPSEQTIGQVNAKLAALGTNEEIGIDMAGGAATVSGPVTCSPTTGASSPSGPTVKVLVGTNGTEVIAAGQSAGNTAEGSFHMASCSVFAAGSEPSGNSGTPATVQTQVLKLGKPSLKSGKASQRVAEVLTTVPVG